MYDQTEPRQVDRLCDVALTEGVGREQGRELSSQRGQGDGCNADGLIWGVRLGVPVGHGIDEGRVAQIGEVPQLELVSKNRRYEVAQRKSDLCLPICHLRIDGDQGQGVGVECWHVVDF